MFPQASVSNKRLLVEYARVKMYCQFVCVLNAFHSISMELLELCGQI